MADESQVFGPYTLLHPLARGGMATTWLARVTGDEVGHELVIKRMLPEVSGDADVRALFAEEARTAMLLDHEHLVRTWDWGEVDGESYIAMEYVWGQDLRQIVERGQSLGQFIPLRMVVEIVARAARGLFVAHNVSDDHGRPLGLVHRDISPPNLMVGFDGRVKVVDFGIARAESHWAKVRPGQLKGKFSYMSPEQVQGLEIDHRSDLFALGIVLYELTTKKRLFRADSDMATIRMVADARFDPPHRVRADYPPRLEEIVMTALARDPADRYADAWQMAQALDHFLQETRAETTTAQIASYMKEIFADLIEDAESTLGPGYAGPTGAPRIPRKAPEPAPQAAAPKRQLTPSGPVVSVTHMVQQSDDEFVRASRSPNLFLWGTGGLVMVAIGLAAYMGLTRGTGSYTLQEVELLPSLDDLDVPPPARPDPPPRTTVAVTSEPAGAAVVLNGVLQRGRTPLDVAMVQQSVNSLALYLPGHLPVQENLEVGDTQGPLSFSLTALQAPADWQPTPATEDTPAITEWTPPMGTLRIETLTAAGPLAGAEVLLNGAMVEGTTPVTFPAPAGVELHLVVRLADHNDTVAFTRVPAGETRDLRLELTPWRGDADLYTNLDLAITPRQATVTLNGEDRGRQQVMTVPMGQHHVVSLAAEDHHPWVRAFDADMGALYYNAVLPAVVQGPSRLTLMVEQEGATIFGQRIRQGSAGARELGRGRVEGRELESGEWEFTFDLRTEEGRQRARFRRTLEAGVHHTWTWRMEGDEAVLVAEEQAPMDAPAAPEPRRRR
jgi:serine/threonine protein kinase